MLVAQERSAAQLVLLHLVARESPAAQLGPRLLAARVFLQVKVLVLQLTLRGLLVPEVSGPSGLLAVPQSETWARARILVTRTLLSYFLVTRTHFGHVNTARSHFGQFRARDLYKTTIFARVSFLSPG